MSFKKFLLSPAAVFLALSTAAWAGQSKSEPPAVPAEQTFRDQTVDSATLRSPFANMRSLGGQRYFSALKEGKDLYFQNCFSCHGAYMDGRGPAAPSMTPPPSSFRAPGFLRARPDAYLFWRIAKGWKAGPRENGKVSAMPVWEGALDQDQIWKIILWIRDYCDDAYQSAQASLPWHGRTQRGLYLYRLHCGQCHGYSGDGRGPAADGLAPPPRDFTVGGLGTDAALERTVREGVAGTAMPGLGASFDKNDLREIISYIRSLSTRQSP